MENIVRISKSSYESLVSKFLADFLLEAASGIHALNLSLLYDSGITRIETSALLKLIEKCKWEIIFPLILYKITVQVDPMKFISNRFRTDERGYNFHMVYNLTHGVYRHKLLW